MRYIVREGAALGALAVGLFLGGCAGAQPTMAVTPGSLSMPQRACGEAPAGEAQCMAVIESLSAQPNVAGLTPADFQARYKLPSGTKGAGQIVALVDAYDNPNVASDLAEYRTEFGLGTAAFTKYNQLGQTKNYPTPNSAWGVEIDLDVEMASASCPLCTIYLIEANSAGASDLESAEKEAVKLGAHIVSNGWSCPGSGCVNKSYFDTRGVEYLASDGDGGYGEVDSPASFASVAAIGGTTLTKTGSGYTETVWDDSAGGCLTNVKKPKWQHDTVCAGRAAGDASAVANDVASYDSYQNSGWITVGGTSISAPLLAGIFGLAGNASSQDGGRTFWEKRHVRDLYDVCASACLFSQYSYAGGWGSPDGIGAF
jgi:subtilase family serine protease